MPIQIEASDVIRLILQFLCENGLFRTLEILREESGVTLNTLSDPSILTDAIREGRWDSVMSTLSTISLPPTHLFDLYEVLLVELASMGELDAARTVLRNTVVMKTLREEQSRRFQKLESFLSQASLTGVPVETPLFGTSLEARRNIVAAQLRERLVTLPANRLLSLLGDALRQQVQDDLLPPDTVFDIFHGVVPGGSVSSSDLDLPAVKLFASRQFTAGAHVECAAFSSTVLAVGLADGFIELCNPVTGRRKELSYQASEANMMVMQHAVICMEFGGHGNENLLAVGTQGGEAAIWKVDSGVCIKRIPELHKDGITAIRLSRDGQVLATSGYDGIVRLSSVRSGRIIKELRRHTSFVTDICFGSNESTIYSCGADGLVCIWDIKRGSCSTLTPFSADRLSHGPLVRLIPCTGGLYVCSKAGQLARLLEDGTADAHIVLPALGQNVVTVVSSPKHRYLYLVHEKEQVSCIDTHSGAIVANVVASSTDLIGAATHPLYIELVTFDIDGQLKLWKPA
jgi:WD40 repeat-containing protein SMU1